MADEQGQNRPNRPIRPRQAPGSRRKRRVVIDSGANRPRPDSRQARNQTDLRPKTPREVVLPTGPVTVQSGVTVKELSQALGIPVAAIIKIMMGLGEMATITQSLSDEAVQMIAADPGVSREVTIKHASEDDDEPETYEDDPAALQARPPVVTIMGHVDHGKTTLLDAIRESAVVETEAGGITQHIGAYQVEHNGRRLTFLDTPGHEAFTAMRARGAKVTDIAVLVVAADDGVMPQTRESISHATAAKVPIVVAVNKIDMPDADPNRVRGDLAGEGLQPEEWGGSTQFSDVSAKLKENLNDLLEKVLLVADAELELTANPDTEASGPIIESRLDVGRGPVATMLIQRGTLRVGDAIVAGDAWGRVRALYDFRGEKLEEAKPGDPVEILGFDHPPPGGELARVVENERDARQRAQIRGERLRREELATAANSGLSLEQLFTQMQTGSIQDLNLILKGDVLGSVEAAVSELQKIQHPEVRVHVIHQGVGGITENDVNLASASSALVVGFNVRPSAEARGLAEREGVEIRTYRVIYQLTDDIQQALVGMLAPVTTEETIGEAEVRQLFRVSRLGTIAGCYVTNGTVKRSARVRVVRDGTLIYETSIAQLRRFKDDVREVQEGFECGILLEGFNDVKEGDILELYETRSVERTDLSAPPTPQAGSNGADPPDA
ncbi:MAG: translation initiation factor IF-2 [Actinobacteria bacterium]|nr:translation initiation factor IF-2 [Actinomycetota bacterium]